MEARQLQYLQSFQTWEEECKRKVERKESEMSKNGRDNHREPDKENLAMMEVKHGMEDNRNDTRQRKEKNLQQLHQGPNMNKEGKNSFVVLGEIDLVYDGSNKKDIQTRDPRKGKEKLENQEETKMSKREPSNMEAKAVECTSRTNKEQPNYEGKEDGKETTSPCIPFGGSLKVDEKDLFKGGNKTLSRKQKRKTTRRMREAQFLEGSNE